MKTAFIVCGALAREVLDIIDRHGWDVDVAGVPAIDHMHPERIAPDVEKRFLELRHKYGRVIVVFGDCGSRGALDEILVRYSIERVEGPHCYEMYAGQTFHDLMEEEPGTFFLTDFLARGFRGAVLRGLGLDRFPQLKDEYFRNYKRLVYLAQNDDVKLIEKAEHIASYLGLPLEIRHTGYGLLEERLVTMMEKRARTVLQRLSYGQWEQERPSPPDTPFANTGRRLYVIGDIDGNFRPRSNPYDLYNFGAPLPNDPLANELQGVWAQPVKALDGYTFTVEVDGASWPLLNAAQFTQTFATVKFDYMQVAPGLKATRSDFVDQDRPILFTTLILKNEGSHAVDVKLLFSAYFDLEDAWFGSLAKERNSGETVQISGDRIIARAHSAPDAWAVAIGSDQSPMQVQITEEPDGARVGHMKCTARLSPGQRQSWTFAIVVESESGPGTALRHLAKWLPQQEALLAEKEALYQSLQASAPRLRSPDAHFDMAFDVARANMQMLEAESPALGLHFYAGLEMFPFWFSNDGAYSLPGLLASNLAQTAENHLLIGARFHENGRIPHQISPAGHIVAAGAAQETPQWVTAVWDFYRWTGDRDFLKAAYPTAVAGLFNYTLGTAGSDGDGYPEGPGIIERAGMAPKKVDATCYLWQALTHLAQMADVLEDGETAARAAAAAADLQTRFDADWWLPPQELYADSLGSDNAPRFDGHWTTAVPLEVGLATPEHGRLALARIRRDMVNEWGLVHTLGEDERVWTLPTATLGRGAYRYNDAQVGFTMLQNLAQTVDHGSIGLYHELIPTGLSFVQLWSGATFVRGVVEDLIGVNVCAGQHAVMIAPRLPAGWAFARLEHLTFGNRNSNHVITVHATHDGLIITHDHGPAPLSVTCRIPADGAKTTFMLEPGKTKSHSKPGESNP